MVGGLVQWCRLDERVGREGSESVLEALLGLWRCVRRLAREEVAMATSVGEVEGSLQVSTTASVMALAVTVAGVRFLMV
jgi:hypothetical protein